MSFTVTSILGTCVLFKFNDTNERYWIALGVIVALATKLGVNFNMFSTIITL